MNAASAHAPGKIILLGEHAVVYGHPAIAVPVTQVRATVTVTPAQDGAGFRIMALDIKRHYRLSDAGRKDPLAAIVRRVLAIAGLRRAPDAVLTLTSTIPIAAGLGSGAACSTAIARALAAYLEISPPLDNNRINALVYDIEQLHHGTPSGIDNTVIVYGRPVYFRRERPIETFGVKVSFQIAIADTGIASPTRIAVGDVRQAWQAEPDRYERLFDDIGALAHDARQAIEDGAIERLGPMLTANHLLLRRIGVSCPELDRLVTAATDAGAAGAKLSGGGRGGNMIALVDSDNRDRVVDALKAAGAKSVMVTQVGTTEDVKT